MLLGFDKVMVKAGATLKGHRVALKAQDLEMWDRRLKKYVVEASDYDIMVGQSSVDPKTVTKTLTVAAS